jgi:putative tricarboxylic transport membrane protein
MRRYDFPAAPVVIGLVLGPLLEQSFRQSIAIGQGDPTIFVTRPISCVLLLIAFAIPVFVGLSRIRHRSKAAAAARC